MRLSSTMPSHCIGASISRSDFDADAQIQSLMDFTDRVQGCVSERDLGESPEGWVWIWGDVKYKYEESQDVPESGVSDQMRRWWGASVNIRYIWIF